MKSQLGKITYDYGEIDITSLVITTDRSFAEQLISKGQHLLFCPAMTEGVQETNVYVLCTMKDTEAQSPYTKQNSANGVEAGILQSLEKSIRIARSQI